MYISLIYLGIRGKNSCLSFVTYDRCRISSEAEAEGLSSWGSGVALFLPLRFIRSLLLYDNVFVV
jgi:hypothetical protein